MILAKIIESILCWLSLKFCSCISTLVLFPSYCTIITILVQISCFCWNSRSVIGQGHRLCLNIIDLSSEDMLLEKGMYTQIPKYHRSWVSGMHGSLKYCCVGFGTPSLAYRYKHYLFPCPRPESPGWLVHHQMAVHTFLLIYPLSFSLHMVVVSRLFHSVLKSSSPCILGDLPPPKKKIMFWYIHPIDAFYSWPSGIYHFLMIM